MSSLGDTSLPRVPDWSVPSDSVDEERVGLLSESTGTAAIVSGGRTTVAVVRGESIFTTHQMGGEGSIGGWEYCCCNTFLLSRYDKYCIIIA